MLSFDVIATFLTVAMFAVFIIIVAVLGVVAWWMLLFLIAIWLAMAVIAAIMGLVSLFSRPRKVYRPDCYAAPFCDSPKVPHG